MNSTYLNTMANAHERESFIRLPSSRKQKSFRINHFLKLLIVVGLFSSCQSETKTKQSDMNPFYSDYNTPFEVPAFDLIELEHFLPAFIQGMEEQKLIIEEIINSEEEASFINTIEALEYSDGLLNKVSSVFSNQRSADTSDELQAIAKEVVPMLAKHSDDIALNSELFSRVKFVYDNQAAFLLNEEQRQLLEKKYKSFVRGGANLPAESQDRFRAINTELSSLTLQFGENQLRDANAWEMLIGKDDLGGLPESVVAGALAAAEKKGYTGQYLFTMDKPSFIPFLTYSDRRDLRERILKGYNHLGDNNNEYDNKDIVEKIVNLRIEKANLLGYATHSDFILENNMANTPAMVYGLLDKIWEKALPNAKKEVAELQKIIEEEGNSFNLEAWDWWYYAEKLRKEKYDLDEEMIRPYFVLENVEQGVFDVANKLWGITFTKRTDIPVYHPDASAYEVKESDGKHIGILMTDYHPRSSKRSGAWMSSYRKQMIKDGEFVTPIITVVCNFTKPTANQPSLLTFDEVSTLFHEFGHALHGLLSDCTYPSLSGTSVPRDFVELPSQIMENWAAEPEVLKMFAKHYETGELIPDELIAKISESGTFNQGFITVEFMSAAYLDMAYHTLTETTQFDVTEFEQKALDGVGMIPEIVVRYRSTYFGHIFSGGYSSGYYAYLWSAWLDADAFEAFKETSLFDPQTAANFRDFVLSKGGTEEAMSLYMKFRGKEPMIEPLLKRKGLL